METYNIKKKTNVRCKAIKINRQQITNSSGGSNKAVVKRCVLKTTCLPPVLHFLLCKCLFLWVPALPSPPPTPSPVLLLLFNYFGVIYDPLEGPRACSPFAFLLSIISHCSWYILITRCWGFHNKHICQVTVLNAPQCWKGNEPKLLLFTCH